MDTSFFSSDVSELDIELNDFSDSVSYIGSSSFFITSSPNSDRLLQM